MLMARVLGALKVQIDVIVSSPLKRALQTAQFVGTELGYEAKVEISPALGLNADYAAFQKMLAKYSDHEGVLVVGHNPHIFQFLGRLITANGGAAIRMRKGSIARVDLDRHPPLLRWLIDPRMARSIYLSVAKSSRPKSRPAKPGAAASAVFWPAASPVPRSRFSSMATRSPPAWPPRF